MELSYQIEFFIPSSGRSELTATKELESTMVFPSTSEQFVTSPKVTLDIIFPLVTMKVAGKGGQHSPTRLVQLPTTSIGLAVVAQVSHKPISEPVMTLTNPIVSVLVSLSSPMASDDGVEEFVGSEGLVTTNNKSNFEGAHLHGPTIKELVGDLEKSWGNSKDWIL